MRSTERTWAVGCVAGVTAALAACGVPSGELEGDQTSPSASAAADVAASFDVGDGRKMFMECQGTGSPTVVIIAGQRAAAGDWMVVADGVSSPPVSR